MLGMGPTIRCGFHGKTYSVALDLERYAGLRNQRSIAKPEVRIVM